jgi:hypothetical protein
MNKLYEIIDDKHKWGQDEDGIYFKSCPDEDWLLEKCEELELPISCVAELQDEWDDLVFGEMAYMIETREEVAWQNANGYD